MSHRICWCNNSDLTSFGNEYAKCEACGTLVSLNSLTDEQLIVNDDEKDFYGKQYWLGHQKEDLGFPDIYTRARNDLTERNLHWLKTLLKYKLPKSKVMELGCSHGSFVALLKQAGYTASGVEMSPWVVSFGCQTFDVPIYLGPVENLDIEPGSLDAIALMDVLEHLPNPAETIRHCFKLLKEDGILLVQTPNYPNDIDYQEMVDCQSPFLSQLKTDEHLYLFSQRSVSSLFEQLGVKFLTFEPAIFDHYDMCLVASRTAPQTHTPQQWEEVLKTTTNGRLVLALIDIRNRELELTQKVQELTNRLNESELDREARLAQIYTLTAKLNESELKREQHVTQIHTLTAKLNESELDREARLAQIHTLTTKLNESELELEQRITQIRTLTANLNESELELEQRITQIRTLTANLNESELDREARLAQIHILTDQLTNLQRGFS